MFVAVLGSLVAVPPCAAQKGAVSAASPPSSRLSAEDRIVADAIFKSGVQASRMGDFSRAIILLSKAVEMDPSLTDGYRERGNAYLSRAAAYDLIERSTRAIIQNPSSATDAFVDRATAYYNVGDYDAARADFNEALARDPERAEAYYRRGLVYLSQGDYVKATADYRAYVRKLLGETDNAAPTPRRPTFRHHIL